MKNVIIGVLILAVALLGFLLFTNEASAPDASDNDTTSQTSSESTSSGKELSFANSGISSVPTDKLDDKSVVILDVSGNNLTGSLPSEIGKLTNLEVLNASNNNMTGVPAEIGQLTKLKTINYANNDLSGLPMELGNLSNLKILDLRGNPNISTYDISLIQPNIPNAQILTD